MNVKTTNNILACAFAASTLFSYFCIPDSFWLRGGPCNAGIEVLIIHFVLFVCSILLLFSLIGCYFPQSKGWKSVSKAFSIMGFFFWLVFSLFHLTDHFIYFIPFLLISGGIVWQSHRKPNNSKSYE